MDDLPRHDELHVVSDIHMGGEPGFQILKETQRLANFVRWVGGQSPAGNVALVLNGDVIDTLAENSMEGYIALEDAVTVVRRIMSDSSFRDIWQAFAEFVKKPGRTLVFVLGNHDLEVSFPPVQRLIRAQLAGNDAAARGRIEFSTAGAGYACRVGPARVFCTHGNEVDEWNFVRYEDLSRAARRLEAGPLFTADEWRPNAGAKMVRDVMNGFKQRYRWVDLLKPEMQAAVSVLAALDSSVFGKLGDVAKLLSQSKVEQRELDQRLSGPSTATTPVPPSVPLEAQDLLGPNLRAALGVPPGTAGGRTGDDMLLDSEMRVSGPGDSMRVGTYPDRTLGTGQYLWDRLRGIEPDEALRHAVKDWIHDDKSFELTERDDTFKRAIESISTEVDFIITGHTHLERAIAIDDGRYYFNTGTWIRLMRFTDAMLADRDSFRPIYEVLTKGDMASLDQPPAGVAPILLNQTSTVAIVESGGKAVGQLYHVDRDGSVRTPIGSPFIKA